MAPTDPVHAILQADEERQLDVLRWGLAPWWSKHTRGAARIDASAEAIATQPAYREPSETRRCLVVAGGYVEWRRLHERRKQPYSSNAPTGTRWPCRAPAIWRHPDGGQRTCSIDHPGQRDGGTTARPHARDPPPRVWGGWLDPGNHDTVTLNQPLVPAPPRHSHRPPGLAGGEPLPQQRARAHRGDGTPVRRLTAGPARPRAGTRPLAPWIVAGVYGDHTPVGLRSHLGAPLRGHH
jgi:SOS response associated peptidase (SRAP)